MRSLQLFISSYRSIRLVPGPVRSIISRTDCLENLSVLRKFWGQWSTTAIAKYIRKGTKHHAFLKTSRLCKKKVYHENVRNSNGVPVGVPFRISGMPESLRDLLWENSGEKRGKPWAKERCAASFSCWREKHKDCVWQFGVFSRYHSSFLSKCFCIMSYSESYLFTDCRQAYNLFLWKQPVFTLTSGILHQIPYKTFAT